MRGTKPGSDASVRTTASSAVWRELTASMPGVPAGTLRPHGIDYRAADSSMAPGVGKGQVVAVGEHEVEAVVALRSRESRGLL